METFSALLAICAGNSPVTGEFPTQRPVTRSFDVFFDLHLNKRLSKQSWGWWFETPSRPLWRHSNEATVIIRATEFYTTLVIRGGHESFYKATISPMRSRLTQYCQAWYMMSFIRGGIELEKIFYDHLYGRYFDWMLSQMKQDPSIISQFLWCHIQPALLFVNNKGYLQRSE